MRPGSAPFCISASTSISTYSVLMKSSTKIIATSMTGLYTMLMNSLKPKHSMAQIAHRGGGRWLASLLACWVSAACGNQTYVLQREKTKGEAQFYWLHAKLGARSQHGPPSCSTCFQQMPFRTQAQIVVNCLVAKTCCWWCTCC